MNFDSLAFAQLFETKGYTGEEAATLLLRLQLLLAVKSEIESRNWTQSQAAKVLDLPQPRISEICSMRIDKFSVELLIKFLFRLERDVHVSIEKFETAPGGEH